MLTRSVKLPRGTRIVKRPFWSVGMLMFKAGMVTCALRSG
jgi:hypothetical protein